MTPNSVTIEQQKKAIRHEKRAARRALSKTQQQHNEIALAQQLIQSEFIQQAENIAVYFANDGEPSLETFIREAIQQGKRCYLPRIDQHKQMRFHRYNSDTKLVDNQYGIPEPLAETESIESDNLDLVCLPLVAYDPNGRRLGMGGGYYDRCFEFKQNSSERHPILIGIAHSIQACSSLPEQSWDIPLDAIANEEGILTIDKNAR